MIIGAMTARTAFDYLDRKPFDAVLLDMEPGDISTFLSGIRNHPAHFDVPVIVLGAEGAETAGWIDQGATDVVDDGCLDGDLRRITLDLVREQRFRRSLRAVYARGRHLETNDSLTGLYSRGFLMAHLQRACQDAALRGEVFSVAGFNVQGLHETNLEFGYAAGDRVLRQIGVMMARLSRAEDLAARYGGHFVLVMPGTTLEESERPVDRICGIIRATELVLPEGGRSRAELTTRRVLLDPEESIEAMLDRLFK
jgi:diguanylate cyclase (GGDEF)-like protein